MKPTYPFLLLLLTVAFPALACAQFGLSAAELDRIPALRLPAQDNAALLATEQLARKAGRPDKFAVALPVSARPSTTGRWTREGSTSVWRLRVHSPGAKTLNLGFSEYHLPDGAQLFLLSATEKYGPFTAADNEDHNQLWTPLLEGDDLIVELRVPTNSKKYVRLYLTAVNHDFQGVTKFVSGACNLDVICGEADGWGIVDGYRDIIRSVAAYTIGGTDICTGFLVNNVNQDGTPFFMTANHCNVTPNRAPALVAYWNFQSDVCRQPGSAESGELGFGNRNIFNTGATHLASFADSDMTITMLDDAVNPAADAFFAGWDANAALPSDTVVAVHHPGVDEKRISFSFNQTYRTNNGGGTPSADGNLLEVPDWSIGTTEGGSSGSPLFDVTGHVRGQLFGGQAACGNDEYDVYGYFPVSWEGGGTPSTRLKDWLDPCGTGTLKIEGLEDSAARLSLTSLSNCFVTCNNTTLSIPLTVGPDFPDGTMVSVSSVPDVLTATTSVSTVSGNDEFRLLVTFPEDLAPGQYTVIVTAASPSGSDDIEIVYNVDNSRASAPELVAPVNGATNVDVLPTLEWNGIPETDRYDVEVADNANFTSPAFSVQSTEGLTVTIDEFLTPNTTYFWRVRGVTACGGGDWTTFNFTTSNVACTAEEATDLPVTISGSGTPTVTSTLISTTEGSAIDMEVTVVIDHSFVGDLDAVLTSPDGTSIQLFSPILDGNCGGSNLSVTFSDGASQDHSAFVNTCTGDATSTTGTFRPAEPFTTFLNEGLTGEWTLTVNDGANFDGGSIREFSIFFCGEGLTGTQEFGDDRTVSVYPNPARNQLTVETTGNWPGQLKGALYDASGRLVAQHQLTPAGRTDLNISGLAAGVYYLRLRGAGQERTERIVVLP